MIGAELSYAIPVNVLIFHFFSVPPTPVPQGELTETKKMTYYIATIMKIRLNTITTILLVKMGSG